MQLTHKSRVIYPFDKRRAADQCTWTCGDMPFTTIPVAVRFNIASCCSLRTHDIFANGVGALRMPAFFTHI